MILNRVYYTGGGAPLLQDKLVTVNGVVTADEGYDGLGRVEVRVASSAELPTLVDSIAYTSQGDGTCIVSGIGNFTGDDLVIPTVSPFGETVVGIAENAFSGVVSLLSATLPRSITAIPDGCFNGCAALTELRMTDAIVSVGDSAFSGCTSLEAIYYHGDREDYASIDVLEEGNTAFSAATVYYIGTADGLAFSSNGDGTCTVTGIGECALQSFTIPVTSPSGDTVVAIGANAFKDNLSLMHVEFPQTLTKIDTYAFYGCKALRGIVLPAGITTLGNYAFSSCVGLKEMVLPDGITSLGTHCFNQCSGLTAITLPRTVTTIPKNLLDSCASLTRIVVPKEVKTISQWAFNGCTALREMIFEEGSQLTKIETYAMSSNPNLVEIKLPPLLTTTAGYILNYCTALARCNYPSDLSPSDNTFAGLSGLRRVDIEDIAKFCQKGGSSKNRPTHSAPNLVYYYDGEPLIHFTVPADVTLLGSYAFYQYKSLQSVVLHDAVTSIGSSTFDGCTALTSATLGSHVVSIGGYAFRNCSAMTEVHLPRSLASIGSYAFDGCSALSDVYYGGSEEEWALVSVGTNNTPLGGATMHFGAALTEN